MKTLDGCEAQPSATLQTSSSSIVPVFFLAVVCCVCMFFNRVTLVSFWGDSGRWLFETWRAYRGELPYKDFAWQYPPLSIWALAAWFRLLGPTFASAQLALDALSLIIVALFWIAGVRIGFSRELSSVLTATFCIFATFAEHILFSLDVYTPSILIANIGLMMVLIGAISCSALGRKAALILGCNLCLLSKPEFGFSALVTIATMMLIESVLSPEPGVKRNNLGVLGLALCVAPSALIYLWVARIVGAKQLLAGLGGYGALVGVCPWWPTGITMLAAIGRIGLGILISVALLALVSLLSPGAIRLRAAYRKYWFVAGFGAIAFAASWIVAPDKSFTKLFISTQAIFNVALWASVCFWLATAWKAWKQSEGKAVSSGDKTILILTSCVLALTLRGAFGNNQTHDDPIVYPGAIPLLFLVGTYLMTTLLSRTTNFEQQGSFLRRQNGAAALVILLSVVYVGARLAKVKFINERRSSYTVVHTLAGDVRVKDGSVESKVYNFIIANTTPEDFVLDTAYGGIVNFAARRRSPIFSTQFILLNPDEEVRSQDLSLAMRNPPRYVIGYEEPLLAASVGSVVCCSFPRIVWSSSSVKPKPKSMLPVIEFLSDKYHPVVRCGKKPVFGRAMGLDEAELAILER